MSKQQQREQFWMNQIRANEESLDLEMRAIQKAAKELRLSLGIYTEEELKQRHDMILFAARLSVNIRAISKICKMI